MGRGREERRNKDTQVMPILNVPSSLKVLDLQRRSLDIFKFEVVEDIFVCILKL